MKLGELKSKIRNTKGSPMLQIELTPGALGTIALMKTPLMEALDTMYPGGKSVETGLLFEVVGDNAMIRPIAHPAIYGVAPDAPGPLLNIMEAPEKIVNLVGPETIVAALNSTVGEKMIINLLDETPAKPSSASLNLLDLDTPAPVAKSSTLLDF